MKLSFFLNVSNHYVMITLLYVLKTFIFIQKIFKFLHRAASCLLIFPPFLFCPPLGRLFSLKDETNDKTDLVRLWGVKGSYGKTMTFKSCSQDSLQEDFSCTFVFILFFCFQHKCQHMSPLLCRTFKDSLIS